MSTLNDAQITSLAAQGYTAGTLNDRIWAWLFDQCAGGGGSSSPPTDSADTCIMWGEGPNFTAEAVEDGIEANCNLYFYEGSNGQPGPEFPSSCGYYVWNGVDTNDFAVQAVIEDACTPFSDGVYIVKFDVVEVVSGTAPVQLGYQPGREGQYWDLFRQDIRVDDSVADGTRQEVVIDVTVAKLQSGDPNAGTGVPVPGSEGVRRVTLIAERRS